MMKIIDILISKYLIFNFKGIKVTHKKLYFSTVHIFAIPTTKTIDFLIFKGEI